MKGNPRTVVRFTVYGRSHSEMRDAALKALADLGFDFVLEESLTFDVRPLAQFATGEVMWGEASVEYVA